MRRLIERGEKRPRDPEASNQTLNDDEKDQDSDESSDSEYLENNEAKKLKIASSLIELTHPRNV